MAQADRSKMKSPNAVFEFVVSADDEGGRDKIQMEFSHEELFQFYGQVVTIFFCLIQPWFDINNN